MRESTDLSETSEDAELDDVGHDSMKFVGKMVRSSNAVDKRLIALFKLRQEEHMIQPEIKKAMTMRRKNDGSAGEIETVVRRGPAA